MAKLISLIDGINTRASGLESVVNGATQRFKKLFNWKIKL